MFPKLFQTKSKYQVGQVWQYQTRKGEENSTFTIVAMEEHERLGTIINIYVDNVRILNIASNGYLSQIHHLPFSKDAIEQSIIKLKGKCKNLPNYEEGYIRWKEEFDKGDAGVFSITIKEAVAYMEQAINV